MELKIPTSANRYSAIDASAAIIALLLIFAGSSKIQANTFRILYVTNSPKEILLVLLGALEVAWSMWFFVNSRTRHAWIFTLAMFTSFLIYGIYSMYTLTPCECFGKTLNETWWVVILDAAVITVVAIVLRRNSLVLLVKWSLFTPAAFGLLVVVLAVAGNSFLYNFSNLTQSIQLVKEKVSVSGISPETREFVADVRIMNSSRIPLQIIGIRPYCGVKYSAALPLQFASGETTSIDISSRLEADRLTEIVPLSFYTSENGSLREYRLNILIDASNFTSIMQEKKDAL